VNEKIELKSLIDNNKARIGVIGLGQVGLPTALSFCNIGFEVIGHDVNKKMLSNLSKEIIPFEENRLSDLLKACLQKNSFSIEHDIEKTIEFCDILIVCVPTPLSNDVRPDLSALEKVSDSFSKLELKNKLIIIESSIPPGTFENLVLPSIEKKNKLGVNCWAAFVPERLAPGQAFSEIRNTPRIIGCSDVSSGKLTQSLYQKLVSSEIFVTPVKVAEISKLVENTFRDVNIALANEVGLICEKYGIDFLELQKVCNSHPRVNLLSAGPGVGGPCLPKDPYLLLNPKNSTQIDSKIILNARQINDSMPLHVASLVKQNLEKFDLPSNESKIAILGVTYKANVSDTRLSPAQNIIAELIRLGSKVEVYDPKSNETFGGKKVSDVWYAISDSDVLVLLTDHEEFSNLDLTKIKSKMKTPIIVDTRRIFDNKKAEDLGITYTAVGYGNRKNNKNNDVK